jgi:hypothetical protein
MVALFVLLFVTPVGGGLLFGAGMRLTANLGVPLEAIQIGYSNFHFWR